MTSTVRKLNPFFSLQLYFHTNHFIIIIIIIIICPSVPQYTQQSAFIMASHQNTTRIYIFSFLWCFVYPAMQI